jgi:hypothetical protein
LFSLLRDLKQLSTLIDSKEAKMGSPTTPTPPTKRDRLLPGEGVLAGGSITSMDNRFNMTMQMDGNLVLYGPQNQPLWASNTNGHSDVYDVVMQIDGNLVIYDTNNNSIWASYTDGNPGAFLVVHIDGNAVIYDAKNESIWATDTVVPATPPGPTFHDRLLSGQGLLPGDSIDSADSEYKLTLQSDGNLVQYGPNNQPIWASNTISAYIWDAVMQPDGNLVVYDVFGRSHWASDTSGNAGAYLVVEDGGFVIFNAQNKSIWSVGTVIPGASTTSTISRPQTISTKTTGIETSSTSTSSISSQPITTTSNSIGHVAGIVGGVLAIVIVVLLGACVYFWLAKRKRALAIRATKQERASANLSPEILTVFERTADGNEEEIEIQ